MGRKTLLGVASLALTLSLAGAPSLATADDSATRATPSTTAASSNSAAPVAARAAAKPKKKKWRPAQGIAFNNPLGRIGEKARLMSRLIAAINHTPKGERIRIAAYSFDRQSVYEALVRARKRGVYVQMLLNDNWTSRQTLRLRKLLGHNVRKRNFVKICTGSCRGGPGNLHLKVYSFSKSGAARDVLMTGSHNMTDRAVRLQWNDLYTINGNEVLFKTFKKVFNQMKWDKRVSPRWVYFDSGAYSGQYYRTKAGAASRPEPSVSDLMPAARLPGPDQDPVLKRLKDIRCKTVKGAGIRGRTVIRIIMYGWNQDRGKWLAAQVADLKRRNCDIKIIASAIGGGVLKILKGARIDVRSADYDYPVDPLAEPRANFYSHLKILTVNGNLGGKPVHSVWTGSENWSTMSFRNDELILRIDKTSVYRRYLDWFKFISRRATHSFATKPTKLP